MTIANSGVLFNDAIFVIIGLQKESRINHFLVTVHRKVVRNNRINMSIILKSKAIFGLADVNVIAPRSILYD